jgi:hypothetical protein
MKIFNPATYRRLGRGKRTKVFEIGEEVACTTKKGGLRLMYFSK